MRSSLDRPQRSSRSSSSLLSPSLVLGGQRLAADFLGFVVVLLRGLRVGLHVSPVQTVERSKLNLGATSFYRPDRSCSCGRSSG